MFESKWKDSYIRIDLLGWESNLCAQFFQANFDLYYWRVTQVESGQIDKIIDIVDLVLKFF